MLFLLKKNQRCYLDGTASDIILGADIANVVNEAAIRAASSKKSLVTIDELDESLQRILAGSQF